MQSLFINSNRLIAIFTELKNKKNIYNEKTFAILGGGICRDV